WNEAETFCESVKGHLVIIETEEEQKIIEQLLAYGEKNSYWLGGEKDSSSTWKWLNGEALTYKNWVSGQEPNNYGGIENKIMIYRVNHQSSPFAIANQWNDLNEEGVTYNNQSFFGLDNFGFICEWDYENNEENSISILTAELPYGIVGTPYTFSFASNTNDAIWTLDKTLPSGLSLSSSGTISGTPQASGTSNFTITASKTGMISASKNFSITINDVEKEKEVDDNSGGGCNFSWGTFSIAGLIVLIKKLRC
ncbi:MAG: putative Ig domain-containing protein, partial [Synergistaceae bacterium]|nr:putative Ig domain-containing protein [Synergistaceae bacterium]